MKFRNVIFTIIICLSQSSQAFGYYQKTTDSGDLSIRVKSSEGPIEGAVIALTSRFADQRMNVTDAEGACDFRGLRPGTYSLQLVQRSFFPDEESESQMAQLEIPKGQSKSVSLYLVKGGVLKGRVLSIDGSPVIGMPVNALKLDGKGPSLPSAKESNVTAISNDRGEFRIYGLRPGSYIVALNAQRKSSPLKSFPTLFYPGERDSAKAMTLDVVPGQEVSIPDITLDLTKVIDSAIVGMVQGSNGTALTGVSLSLSSAGGFQVSDSTLSDDHGRFVFEGVPPGEYLLKANFASQEYFNLQREIVVKDLAPTNVTLQLRPYPLISGKVFLRKTTGVVPLPSFKLRLEPAQNSQDTIELMTDNDGNFSRRFGSTGSFFWSFPELPPAFFVNRILSDGKNIAHQPVKLDHISSLSEISVELSAGAAEIRGSAAGGICRADSIYAVALDSNTDEIQFVREARCSGDSFRILSLPPGRYYVIGILTSDPVKKSNQQARLKRYAIEAERYDRIEQIVKILKTRGTKVITLEREEILENNKPIVFGQRMEQGPGY